MKSFSYTMMIVLATLGMTASLTAVAQGDTIWGSYSGGGVNAFDMTGTKLTPPSFTLTATQIAGLALSPDRTILYVSKYTSVDSAIQTHDTATGDVINASFASGFTGNPRGLAVDSNGYLYVGKSNGYVDKIAPDGTHTADWGGRLNDGAYHIDVEVVGDHLYAAVILGDAPGVVRYDLSTGGTPTQMTTGRTDGIASGPDGSWYTADGGTGKIYKWSSSWENPTEIGDVGACCFDVDYWDGALYASAYTSGIKKYDLSTETWTDFAPTAGGGYMSTVVMIPEPGTLALLATGLIGLLCYAWRKRR